MNKVLKTNMPLTWSSSYNYHISIINIVRGKVKGKNICFDLKILMIDRWLRWLQYEHIYNYSCLS